MPTEEQRQALAEAMRRVDVLRCWALLIGDAPARTGVYASPFRADAKPSFSVFRSRSGETLCQDKAGHDNEGKVIGPWQFVRLARPGWSAKEICDWFYRESGVPAPQARPMTPAEKRAWLDSKKTEAKQAKERVRVEHAQALHRVPEYAPGAPWPLCVERRWRDGRTLGIAEKCEALDKRRGWEAGWAQALHTRGVISWPADVADRRYVAFLVEDPEGTILGYHQQFVRPSDRDGGAPIKGWQYIPYSPRGESIGGWLGQLQAEADAQGVAPGEAMVQPLPFVIGNLCPGDRPDLVIVTEGQWDALTIFGSLGGYHADMLGEAADHPAWPAGKRVLCLGVRGAQSAAVLLAAWGSLLRRWKVPVWVCADADAAGNQWIAPKWDGTGLRPWSFVEQASALIGREVAFTRLRRPGVDFKDFNDYYRAKRPTAEAMWAWARQLHLLA